MRLKEEMKLQVGGSGLFDGCFFDDTNRIDAARGPGPKSLEDYRRQLVNGSGSLAQSSMSICLEAGSHFVWDLDLDYDFEM